MESSAIKILQLFVSQLLFELRDVSCAVDTFTCELQTKLLTSLKFRYSSLEDSNKESIENLFVDDQSNQLMLWSTFSTLCDRLKMAAPLSELVR